jgi:serine/threonine protein kinase
VQVEPADHLDDNAAAEFVSGTLAPSAISRAERHLARCRDCRALVAALAADAANDSNVVTVRHDRLTESQVAQRPTRTLTIGDRVGRYLVLTALGSGGMGVVFAAYDPQLDRKIALKLLRAGITYNTKDARTRLRREAQAIAQLSHPNVVGVYDVGETDEGDLYIAMEFVEGDTLTTWLKKYPRSWREIVDAFLQAGRGLVAAHSVGLLHRDFKPDNVLVGGDGRVRVTDFGLARSMITDDSGALPQLGVASALNTDLTATGTVLGTPRYMAPEQLVGPDIDARADQFGFCVALYEALYGAHPLPGATSASMLERQMPALPPPDRTKVPPAIGRALARGLERDRAKRFPAMAALIDQLVPRDRRAPARALAVAAGAVVIAASVGGALLVRNDVEPTPPAPVDPLIERLNRVEAERRLVLLQIESLTSERKLERVEYERKLERLSEQLRDKDEQIQELLITRVQPARAAPPARPLVQSRNVTFALEQAERDLEGCFTEWNERVAGPADMVVKLRVNEAGDGHSSSAVGVESQALRLCVAEAVARVKYPKGPEVLDLEVTVQWDSGVVNLSARIVGRGSAPINILDL